MPSTVQMQNTVFPETLQFRPELDLDEALEMMKACPFKDGDRIVPHLSSLGPNGEVVWVPEEEYWSGGVRQKVLEFRSIQVLQNVTYNIVDGAIRVTSQQAILAMRVARFDYFESLRVRTDDVQEIVRPFGTDANGHAKQYRTYIRLEKNKS